MKEISGSEVVSLFILAIPVACIAWTVTHEEVFREPREYCQGKCKNARTLPERKFFYLFTCEYCFSHYVTIAILLLTGFRLFEDDWRGYILSGFCLVWVANFYMSIYNRIRVSIKEENLEIKIEEKKLDDGNKPS